MGSARQWNTFVALFWSKVQFGSGCWEWNGLVLNNGYGQIKPPGEPQQNVHRVAYRITHGPIPQGGSICHHCDNRKCVRPDHLFLGTHKDNMHDMVSKGRQGTNGYETKTQCPQGHPYDEENTMLYQGRRYCRACHKVYSRNCARKKYASQRIT